MCGADRGHGRTSGDRGSIRVAGGLTAAPPLSYTGRVAGKCAATLAFVLGFLAAGVSIAEHEIYYRYTVLGYVKDAAGKLRAGVEVELVREKTGFSYVGETDSTGFYVIIARLGDESIGERLRLRAETRSVSIVARFDPADHVRERGTRVDFLAGQPVETPAAFPATLKRFLGQ